MYKDGEKGDEGNYERTGIGRRRSDLRTLMCEVESVVNGRPITKVSDDPRDLEALTPNHLLLLRPRNHSSTREVHKGRHLQSTSMAASTVPC